MSLATDLALLERDVEFMSFFYQHLTHCPPHGPFRLYSAITLVERARRRFTPQPCSAAEASSPPAQASSSGGAWDVKANDEHERKRRRGEGTGDALLPSLFAGDATSSEGSEAHLRERQRLCEALTTHNVLALMERRYNTSHLCGWPLMYVPAEVHAAEVTALLEVQQQQHRRTRARGGGSEETT